MSLHAPWNASWTGEARWEVRPCRWVGALAVWQPHAPGEGKPIFAEPHMVRQRRSIAQRLCSVCGEHTPEGDRWCFPLGAWREIQGRWMWLTTESPVHRRCADLALQVCPRLRASDFYPLVLPAGVKAVACFVGGPQVEKDFGLVIPPTQRVIGAIKLAFPDDWVANVVGVPVPQTPATPRRNPMSKKLELHPLKSSAISGMHHDPATGKLTVEFSSGKRWEYDDVPLEKAESLRGAQSPGAYFGSKIRGLFTGRELP